MDAENARLLDDGHLQRYPCAGNDLRELIDAFLHSSPPLLDRLGRAVQQRDAASLQRSCHALLGAANSVGAKAVAQICQALLQERAPAKWPALLETLKTVYLQTGDALDRLPAEWPARDEPVEDSADAPPVVLLLEDNEAARTAVHVALDRRYRILDAESGEMALALCEEERPAAALIDLNLGFTDGGDSSGLALIRRLKDRLPVIALTVDETLSTIRAAIRAGAWSYLIKQPSPRQLQATLDAAIARHGEARLPSENPSSLDVATGLVMATYHLAYPEARHLIKATATAQRRRIADIVDDFLTAHAMNTSVRQIANQLFKPTEGPPP